MWQLWVGECARILRNSIPDESVKLIITSPPYGDLRAYGGYVFDFEVIAQQLYRVLQPGGVIVWVVRDKVVQYGESGESFRQALYFKQMGLKMNTMFYEVVNPKPNVQRISYTPAVEYMFTFYKGKPTTTNWILVPSKYANTTTNGSNGRQQGYVQADNRTIKKWKRERNIWRFVVGHTPWPSKHPARFPQGLAQRHILTWTNPGDLVLDPMCGSGMVGAEAVPLGRRFIGIDMEVGFIQEANQTIGRCYFS